MKRRETWRSIAATHRLNAEIAERKKDRANMKFSAASALKFLVAAMPPRALRGRIHLRPVGNKGAPR